MDRSFRDSLLDWLSAFDRNFNQSACQLCGTRTIKFQAVGEVEARCASGVPGSPCHTPDVIYNVTLSE